MGVSGAQQATVAGSKFGQCLVVRRKHVSLAARRTLRDIYVSYSRTTDIISSHAFIHLFYGLFDEVVSS
jgi:hypothetical protein